MKTMPVIYFQLLGERKWHRTTEDPQLSRCGVRVKPLHGTRYCSEEAKPRPVCEECQDG